MRHIKKILFSLVFILIGVMLIGCQDKEDISVTTMKTVLNNTELFNYSLEEDITEPNTITKSLQLKTKIGDYDITWTSSNENILTSEGIIKENAEEGEVTLKASIDVNGTILTKEYNFKVKKEDVPINQDEYKITYHLDGGSHNNESIFLKGDILNLKPATKEGYNFIGWYLDESFKKPLSNEYKIEKNINLYAKFEVIEETASITITLYVEGNEYIDPITYNPNDKKISEVLPEDPLIYDKTFIGWKIEGTEDSEIIDAETLKLTKDTTLIAVFEDEASESYGITDIVDAKEMGLGDPNLLENITIEGVITSSYKSDSSNYNFFIEDSSSAIVLETAIYSPRDLITGNKYRIEGMPGKNNYNRLVFWPNNAELIEENVPLPSHNIIYDVSNETLDYNGLTRLYERFSIEDLVLQEVPTGAGQNAEVVDSEGNSIDIRVHKYLEDEQLESILNQFEGAEPGSKINLSKAPLDFFQWKTDPYQLQFMITDPSQVELTNEVVEKHTVTLIFNNGSPDQYLNIVSGNKIDQRDIRFAYKSGYRFDGWYEGEEIFDFNSQIFSDLILEAKYIKLEEGEYEDGENPIVEANQNDPRVIQYYQSINFNDSPSALFSSLQDLIYQKIGSYSKALTILKESDRDINYPSKIRGIYNGELYSSNGRINREHVMAQSKLPNKTAQKAEVHNLRLSQIAINSKRSNFPFGEPWDLTGNTPAKPFNENGDQFWPGHQDKGDVARIVMFMYVRYNARLDETIEFNVLLKWHLEDPVDAFEIQRNNVIHRHQGNRNPFIDHPEIFESILTTIDKRYRASLQANEQFEATLNQYLDNTIIYIPKRENNFIV